MIKTRKVFVEFFVVTRECGGFELALGKRVIALHNTRQIMKGAKNLVISRFSVWVVIAVMAGLSQGCASFSIWRYGPDGQSREEFEHRVEAVFRLQNRMTSEVMVLQEGDTVSKDQETILQAEQVMQKNCSDLNEYASRDIDGLNKSLLLQRRVENSVVDCENSAHKVEALLNKH
ncbi:MAG: hypothetical protein ABL913_10015 [Methyloglobulus sp.]